MRKKWGLVLACYVLSGLAGCHSAPAASANDEAQMRANFKKTGFDINDVPPAQRERVRALMEASKQAPKAK